MNEWQRAMAEENAKPRWVYVFRNDAGDALYVGCTNNLPRRITEHSKYKPWFGDVASIEASVYPTYEAGVKAELDLIGRLLPRYERSARSRRLQSAATS